MGCLWITITTTTTTLRLWRGTYTKSKGLERAQPESSGPANTIFIFSSFFSQITRYPSSVSSLLWFPFQICLISRLRRPPRVLSLFHHNIQSSVALCVISAASQLACVCVRERHLIISQSYGSVPLIRLEARGKRSKLLFFWTRSFFFFYLHHNGPEPSLTLSHFEPKELIHPFICMYAKPPSTLPLKQSKWNWVALLICLFCSVPKTLR